MLVPMIHNHILFFFLYASLWLVTHRSNIPSYTTGTVDTIQVGVYSTLKSPSRLQVRSMAFDPERPNHLRQDVVDEYPGGNKVTDHYRWLEDPDSSDTVAWVQAQNKITNAYLEKLEARDFLKVMYVS